MPEASRPAPLRRLLAEWPLLGAAAALVSLLWIPRFLPSREALEQADVARLRDLLLRRDYAGVEEGGRAFHRDAAPGPLAGEVHALRGRAALARPTPDAAHAWSQLSAARRLGFRPAEMAALQREAAYDLLDRGRTAEAAEAFRELVADDPVAGLDLGRALAARASRNPADAEALTEEALRLAAAARDRLPPERRVEAVLAAARLARRAGRADDALPTLVRALDEFPSERGRIQLERGRALASLDRAAEALAAFDLAEELLKDGPAARTGLLLAQLEFRARAALPDAAALADRLEAAGPRRVARLLVALGRLASDRPRALREAAEGLDALPSLRALEDEGVDVLWAKRALRSAAGAEDDPDGLVLAALALERWARLEPEDVALHLDRASALRRAGRHVEAGEAFERAAVSAHLDPSGRERAAKEGAEAFVKAERFGDAARLYRRWYESAPRRNAEGLLLQARGLRKASLPGAAEVYAEYVTRSRPGDPGLPEALLERGRLLAERGDREGALAEYERLLTEDLGVSPDAAEWEAALLERGRTLLELGQAEKDETRRRRHVEAARRTLAEYLERYAEGGEIRKGAVEAAWLLGRVAIEQRDWEGALGALDRAVAADVADDRAAAFQREARFLRGDLFFALGRYEDAERAYADASRRHAGSPERLWGVVGRARSLAKLGRVEEARREARTGRALFEQGRDGFEASFGGHGRPYWTEALETLEREVR